MLARGLLIERSQVRSRFSHQVSLLAAGPQEPVLDVCLASDDVIELLLDVRQLQLQVLPELDGRRLRELRVFKLEPTKAGKIRPRCKRFLSRWQTANLLHILQVFYISYLQVIEHVLHLIAHAIKFTIMKCQILFGLFCP